MINQNRLSIINMAYVFEQRAEGVSFKLICVRLGYKKHRKIAEQTLRRYYYYAIKHGFSAWSERPEGV
jgi:hypothetical protein